MSANIQDRLEAAQEAARVARDTALATTGRLRQREAEIGELLRRIAVTMPLASDSKARAEVTAKYLAIVNAVKDLTDSVIVLVAAEAARADERLHHAEIASREADQAMLGQS